MSPREHAEQASKLLDDAEELDMRDEAFPLVIAEAQAHALTALALSATNRAGIAVALPDTVAVTRADG